MSVQKAKRANPYKRKRIPDPPVVLPVPPADSRLLRPLSPVPLTQDDLALHPKKKKELNDLLTAFLHSGSGGVVGIVGPSGCGKSTAVTVYAESMGLDVAVWKGVEVVSEREVRGEQVRMDSVDAFVQYLTMECGVPKIRFGGKPRVTSKVVLVRHFPDICDPEDKKKLGKALATVLSFSLNKLVFITLSNEEHFAMESYLPLAVHILHFNETAPTLLDKAIHRMAELLTLCQTKEELQQIRIQSQGDLRAAMNSLLLISASSSPPSTSKRSKQVTSFSTHGKDCTLDMFHALGKFLIHKSNCNTGLGPNGDPVLMTHEMLVPLSTRPPLYFHPENVLKAIDCDIGLFVHMLHENCIDYMDEMDDISEVMDCFSLGDLVQKPRFGHISPEENQNLRVMEARIVTRALLHYNVHPVAAGKHGFVKSQMRGYGRDYRHSSEEIRHKLSKRKFYDGLTPFSTVLHEEMYFSVFQTLEKEEDRGKTVDQVE